MKLYVIMINRQLHVTEIKTIYFVRFAQDVSIISKPNSPVKTDICRKTLAIFFTIFLFELRMKSSVTYYCNKPLAACNRLQNIFYACKILFLPQAVSITKRIRGNELKNFLQHLLFQRCLTFRRLLMQKYELLLAQIYTYKIFPKKFKHEIVG